MGGVRSCLRHWVARPGGDRFVDTHLRDAHTKAAERTVCPPELASAQDTSQHPRDHAHHARQMQSSPYSSPRAFSELCRDVSRQQRASLKRHSCRRIRDEVGHGRDMHKRPPRSKTRPSAASRHRVTHPHHPCTGAGARCRRTRSHMHTYTHVHTNKGGFAPEGC